MSWAAVAISVGLTATKLASDAQKEKVTAAAKANEVRYSPWSKITPSTEVKYADPGATLAQGAGAGLSMYAGMQNAAANKAIADRLNTGGSMDGYGRDLTLKDNNTQDSMWGYQPPKYTWQ